MVLFLADIQLATNDRLDVLVLGCIYEMDGPKNVAVVGHCNRWHPKFFHSATEFLNVAGAVEHGVISVKVQVNKLRHSLSSILRPHSIHKQIPARHYLSTT